ncbi:glycosyltransferase family 2 protein [Senegalia massiliensis]|uniref:Glycosyltransferase family 2 protein n=1 Tax=Senegalia massiliensis TaxID=1720316 RepID=A0A845QX44_9CLOT|nr:glycosyltransferase family 2 protein [Senegalia massiliensis]NBI07065.1 glycosyltransferase family 2 protein [Senegalia massiliensis]
MDKLNKNNEPSILVVAFNRPSSLISLLESLESAHYENQVRLIISIDGGGGELNDTVKNIARNYQWPNGEKIIIMHEENLGLRNHILKAGNLTQKYGDIIMLEDDLYVSKLYYSYSKQALDYYRDENSIAGISLYAQQYNETSGKPFYPLYSESDTYFMQLASSWGQAWTKEQWGDFFEWYKDNESNILEENWIPSNIKKWPSTSWKKYFIKYLIEKEKFFVYPYISLTTNMRAKGVHAKISDNLLQVPMYFAIDKKFSFADFESSVIKYDAFHENINLSQIISIENLKNIQADLYGTKNIEGAEYVLTSKALNFKILRKYGLRMVPHELNVLNDIKGDDLFLYYTKDKQKFSEDKKWNIEYRNFIYYFLKVNPGKRRIVKHFINTIINKIFNLKN